MSNVAPEAMTDFRASVHSVPIERVDQLVEAFHDGSKPQAAWRIGTEWEKLIVDRATGAAAPFAGHRGIEHVLRELAERYGWAPAEESGRVIALARDGASITLEPGGQLELSGAPLRTLHETAHEMRAHVRELQSVCDPLGLAILGLGIQPRSKLDEIEWVPKPRYDVMGPYMLRVGTLGQRMMKQTATVQANVDFSSEADAMRKLGVGQGMSPLVNALFANSCLVEGGLTDFQSFRGHIWTDTDSARSGLLPFAFRSDATFAHYVEWALDVPLYFILRNGTYHTEVTGTPFRRVLQDGFKGQPLTMDDWNLHLTTLFPEVRLKTFLEIRSADGQPTDRVLALPALVKGLFYEQDCLMGAWDLVKGWGYEEVVRLGRDVVRAGLRARIRNLQVLELARELLAISEAGLKRLAVMDASGRDERMYLQPLWEELESGRTLADSTAEAWTGRWQRDIGRLVDELAVRTS